MNNLQSCIAVTSEKSTLERIVQSAILQNSRQQDIESRLDHLLNQLRGDSGIGGVNCQPKPEPHGAIYVLDEAVDRHTELNNSILDKIGELESLLSY